MTIANVYHPNSTTIISIKKFHYWILFFFKDYWWVVDIWDLSHFFVKNSVLFDIFSIPSNSKQSNSKRDSYSKSHNTNGKSFVSRPIIQTPDGSKKYDDRHTSSSLIEETKSEPSNSKIESEYNFEEVSNFTNLSFKPLT